jgi:hypothetical protein
MSLGQDGEDGAPQVFDSSLSVPDQEYTKRRRHKSINDARDRVPDTLLQIEQLQLEGQMHPKEARRATQRAVETLAMDLFWMLEQHPEGEEYLFDRTLGTLRCQPPGVDGEVVDGRFVGELPETPHDFPLVRYDGLQSMLRGPETISAQWKVVESNYGRSDTRKTITTDHYTPRSVSKEAYIALTEFLGKADFGIAFSEDRPLAKVTPEVDAETPPGVQRLDQTDLYKENEKLTVTGDNDNLIVISASSRTPVSGTGKTTLATTIAKALDTSPSGFDAEEQATFSVDEFGYDIISGVEDGSAIIMDEAQGTQSGTGLNARRGMKSESIDTINGLLNNRDKNLTAILIFQDMAMGDSSLYGSVDSWILIRKAIEDRKGPLATHHELQKNDYDWGNPQPKTPALEDLTWDALPDDDPDYSAMEEMKQRAKTSGGGEHDEDSELPEEQQVQIAQAYRNNGKSLQWIANEADGITYSSEWIRQRTTKPEKESVADD